MSKLTHLKAYFKHFKNPISCLLFKFGYKKEVTVKFRYYDEEIKIAHLGTLNKAVETLLSNPTDDDFIPFLKDLESGKEIITVKHGIKIISPTVNRLNNSFGEYYSDYYSNFDINYKDRVIIDIGANCGDTALFFASEGSKVFAFEPVKEYYDIALKNLDLNPDLSKNIEMFNYAVSYKKGKLNIDAMDSVSSYINENDSYEIEVIPIKDIIKNVQPDLLKMDCEGCEYEIIENSDLSMFNELIFEYHPYLVGKDYKILVDKLEKEGFKVEINSVIQRSIDEIGIIHAVKL